MACKSISLVFKKKKKAKVIQQPGRFCLELVLGPPGSWDQLFVHERLPLLCEEHLISSLSPLISDLMSSFPILPQSCGMFPVLLISGGFVLDDFHLLSDWWGLLSACKSWPFLEMYEVKAADFFFFLPKQHSLNANSQ